ncbi:MAG: VanZ family protein, partial [Turicibacter sp.]
ILIVSEWTEKKMRLSDIIRMGREYFVLGIIFVMILLFIFLIGYVVGYKKIFKGQKQLSKKKIMGVSILCCYLFVVFGATLGTRGNFYTGVVSFYPFRSYKEAWNNFSVMEWRNIILNIMMFIPLGFLLPILFKSFKTGWKTYLAGFLLTLVIECLQLVSGRGIFEVGDTINNTVGCMIGYGFVMFFIYVVKDRDHWPLKHLIVLQIPFVITLIFFVSIFTMYNKQELGNLYIAPTYQSDVSNVEISSMLTLSQDSQKAFVYKALVGTESDTLSVANQLFNQFGTVVDETTIDRYDETVVYRSLDGNYSVWVDYLGLTTWFLDYTQSDRNGIAGYTLNEVESILKPYNIDLPKGVEFFDEGNGNYKIVADFLKDDDQYIDGTLRFTLTEDGIVDDFNNDLIAYDPYKEFPIISEKKGYERLLSGKINERYLGENIETISVENIRLGYLLDTKGFYQPVYVFETLVDGIAQDILIEALD